MARKTGGYDRSPLEIRVQVVPFWSYSRFWVLDCQHLSSESTGSYGRRLRYRSASRCANIKDSWGRWLHDIPSYSPVGVGQTVYLCSFASGSIVRFCRVSRGLSDEAGGCARSTVNAALL